MTILNLLCGLFAALLITQNPGEQLKINNIPLEGSLYEFSAKLENNGMLLIDADFDKGFSMFSGSYEGFEDCSIVVNSAADEELSELTVMVKAQSKGVQAIINEVYEPLKKVLAASYGSPVAEIEDFSGREADIRKRIKAGRAATSQFLTADGTVILTIGYDALVGGYFAVVVYDLNPR